MLCSYPLEGRTVTGLGFGTLRRDLTEKLNVAEEVGSPPKCLEHKTQCREDFVTESAKNEEKPGKTQTATGLHDIRKSCDVG